MEQIDRMEEQQAGSASETQRARRASAVSPARGRSERRSCVADPEVPAKAKRRQFPAEYKRRILREADATRDAGEIGALYSSHLGTWRRARERGELAGLTPRRRGRIGLWYECAAQFQWINRCSIGPYGVRKSFSTQVEDQWM